MIRRMMIAGCLSALLAGVSFAGDAAHEDAAAAMMAEMMKCDICKHMGPHLESLGPVMQNDVAHLNDGVAFLHGVSDPAKLDEYRSAAAEMHAAGDACMKMSDEEAAAHLCSMCQGIRTAMQAGAHMSMGNTSNGDMMVLTSDDPAVQKQLTDLGTKCEMMMAGMKQSM